jgi:hypothetical protein
MEDEENWFHAVDPSGVVPLQREGANVVVEVVV